MSQMYDLTDEEFSDMLKGDADMLMQDGVAATVPAVACPSQVDVYVHWYVPVGDAPKEHEDDDLSELLKRQVDNEARNPVYFRDDDEFVLVSESEHDPQNPFVGVSNSIFSNFFTTMCTLDVREEALHKAENHLCDFFLHALCQVNRYMSQTLHDFFCEKEVAQFVEKEIGGGDITYQNCFSLLYKYILNHCPQGDLSARRFAERMEVLHKINRIMILAHVFDMHKLSNLANEEQEEATSTIRQFHKHFNIFAAYDVPYDLLDAFQHETEGLIPVALSTPDKQKTMMDQYKRRTSRMAKMHGMNNSVQHGTFPSFVFSKVHAGTGETRYAMHFVCWKRPNLLPFSANAETQAPTAPHSYLCTGFPAFFVVQNDVLSSLFDSPRIPITLREGNSFLECMLICLGDNLKELYMKWAMGSQGEVEENAVRRMCKLLGFYRDMASDFARTFFEVTLSKETYANQEVGVVTMTCHKYALNNNQLGSRDHDATYRLARTRLHETVAMLQTSALSKQNHKAYTVLCKLGSRGGSPDITADLPVLDLLNMYMTPPNAHFKDAVDMLRELQETPRIELQQFMKKNAPIRFRVQYAIHQSKDLIPVNSDVFVEQIKGRRELKKTHFAFCFSYTSMSEHEKNHVYFSKRRSVTQGTIGCQYCGDREVYDRMDIFQGERTKLYSA